MNNEEKTLEYSLKTFDYDKTRSEPLFLISKIYLLRGEYETALTYANLGINTSKNTTKILSSDLDLYKFGFYEMKFAIMTKIPSTSINDLLSIGLNMISRTSDIHYTSYLFKTVIHQLAVVIDTDKIEKSSEFVGEYIHVIAAKVGLALVLYNEPKDKVYKPIVLDEKYTCIGVTPDYIILQTENCDVYKYNVCLDIFDIIPMD